MTNTPQTTSVGKTPDVVKPYRMALSIAIPYALLSFGYILVSGRVAAALAHSARELQQIEKYKGLGFILVSALFVFVLALVILRRVERNERALLRSQEALVDAERRAMAGTLAACMAHDLNNSLNVIGTGTEVLFASVQLSEERRTLIAHIRKAVRDVSDLAKRLTAAGRTRSQEEFAHVDLVALVRETTGLATSHIRLRSCQVVVYGEQSVPATLSVRLLQAALLNLLLNAADATEGRGRIEVLVRRSGSKQAVIEVSDNGCGITDEVRAQLFTPFFTTKPDGTGLGLLSVKAAVQSHAGQIEAGTSPLGGACFRITLPLIPPTLAG